MAGRNLKFPKPDDYPPATPIVLCPADRVIGLYNQETGNAAQRIAKNMRAWFETKATDEGWAGCKFVPEVQSKHGGGCILLNPPRVSIHLNKITITFPKEEV